MKRFLSIFLVFFLLFGFVSPAFAETTSDVIPPVLDSTGYDSYIICNTRHSSVDTYECILFNSSDYYVYYKGNSSLILLMPKSDSYVAPSGSIVRISDYNNSTANNGWSNFSSLTSSSYNNNVTGEKQPYFYGPTVAPSQGDSVLMSTVDIPYADWYPSAGKLEYSGEIFFSPIPPLVVATGEALTQFQIQTSQTMTIIVLCGIGCLAFLISLPILRKVLLRFLNR